MGVQVDRHPEDRMSDNIALVVLMAVLLFSVDLVFQWLFSSIGILKT